MNEKKFRSLSTVAALMVLALFAVGILSVLLGGASVYRRLTARDQTTYESRTGSQYLATKLRQANSADAVEVTPFGDGDALMINQILEGETYTTWIYCHDGWLMELFGVPEGEYAPEDGEKVMEAASLRIQTQGNLHTLEWTGKDGMTQRLTLTLRGEGGRP